MSELIQICGLPRSGTGFTSVLLSLHPNCIAYHELLAKKDDYKKQISDSLKRYKYVADCSTYGFMPAHTYKNSKKVLIHRSIEECLESSIRVFNYNVDITYYQKARKIIDKWIEQNDVLIIPFKDLFKTDILRKIWFYCFGDCNNFCLEKVEHLAGMNIQMQDPKKLVNDMAINQRILKQLNVIECQH